MSSSAGSAPDSEGRGGYQETRPGREEHAVDRRADRKSVVDHERDEHGGIKIGSAFFGWLTATGMTVLLTALVAAIGAAVGAATNTQPATATDQAMQSAGTISIVGGIILIVILFAAYYCGGYVAGRMARFDGLKQGLAVWLWAVLIAIIVAILAAVAGDRFNVLSQLNSFPRIPISSSEMTTGGVIAAVAVLLASLIGALLGGLAGMHFHRKVDRTGLGR